MLPYRLIVQRQATNCLPALNVCYSRLFSSSSSSVGDSSSSSSSSPPLSAAERHPLQGKESIHGGQSSNAHSRPRASNPNSYREQFKARPTRRRRERSAAVAAKNHGGKKEERRGGLVAHHLAAAGEKVPKSNWIEVENVPPISSLDAMLAGMEFAFRVLREHGILDLDAKWNPDKAESSPLPILSFPDDYIPVKKAKVVLSPFGRMTGWKLQFENRSIVHALLAYTKELPIMCASKRVRLRELKDDKRSYNYPQVSDATIRVENFPDDATPLKLLNFFSRYDLRQDGPSIVQWAGQTSDGKVPPTTWLVHFADASWARAAIREKQSSILDGRAITLVQYPRQIL